MLIQVELERAVDAEDEEKWRQPDYASRKTQKPEKGYLQPLKKMFARREPHTQVNNTDHAHTVHIGIYHTSIIV